MIDLKKLEDNLDKILELETKESLENYLKSERKNKMKKPYAIVEDLNNELYEKIGNDRMWFSYTVDYFTDSIAFNLLSNDHVLKINLWNSENSQQYKDETLEDTIKRELSLVINELNILKDNSFLEKQK